MASNGTEWYLKGQGVTSCNCAWGCPCQFNANPTQGFCEALAAWEVREGRFGDTDLSGARWAEIVHWPGPIHEGNGTMQLIVDASASDEQREAIEALVSGEHGGAFFEIFASVLPNHHETITAPIEIECDQESRIARVKVGDVAESRIEPIKNPVDGSEHRARIDLPEGFEYNIAEVANTVSLETKAEDPLALSLENSYAQLNEIDWAPA